MSAPGRAQGETRKAQPEGGPVGQQGGGAATSAASAAGQAERQRLLWAPQAWVDGRWQAGVRLAVGSDGRFTEVIPGQACPADARRLAGPVLPALVNAHSHAFQRAFAGLAERRLQAQDDFWQWRDRMYAVALRIGPQALRAVAAQLYAELLAGGFSHVCEFHYLHHAPDGQAYATGEGPLTMARALAEAAQDVGMGLTLLPVLYQRAGFGQAGLRPDQRRFATTPAQVLAMRDGIRAWRLAGVDAGVAIHSLRAATPQAIAELLAGCADDDGPIHVHIAEQTAEVDDCLAATGLRPIAWLARHAVLDARWHLVHATHAEPAEIDAVAAAGAGVVLCPSTEANLGDGLCDLPRWLASGTALSLGTDSHVGRQWPAELQALEYGQRLVLRQRNVAAAPQGRRAGGPRGARAGAPMDAAMGAATEASVDASGPSGAGQAEPPQPATAARLLQRLGAGGAAAAGHRAWGLQAGAPADWLVVDVQAPGLLGVPADHLLDALVFSAGAPAWSEVGAAGRVQVVQGRHRAAAPLAAAFSAAMQGLWGPAGNGPGAPTA